MSLYQSICLTFRQHHAATKWFNKMRNQLPIFFAPWVSSIYYVDYLIIFIDLIFFKFHMRNTGRVCIRWLDVRTVRWRLFSWFRNLDSITQNSRKSAFPGGKRILCDGFERSQRIFLFVNVFNIGYITCINFFKYTNERTDINLHHHIIFLGEICGVGLLSNLNNKGNHMIF